MEIKGNDSCINKQIPKPNSSCSDQMRVNMALGRFTMDPKIMWVGKTRYKHIISPNNSQLTKIIIKLTFERKKCENVHKLQ